MPSKFATLCGTLWLFVTLSFGNSTLIPTENQYAAPTWSREVLCETQWCSLQQLATLSDAQLDALLIAELSKRCSDSPSNLQMLESQEVACLALLNRYLTDSGVYNQDQLKSLTLQQQRAAILSAPEFEPNNGNHPDASTSNYELVKRLRTATLRRQLTALIGKVNSVESAMFHKHKLRDDCGRTMDCLKILKLDQGKFLGIYHCLDRELGEFELLLAESFDLLDWKQVAVLGNRDHQGAIAAMGSGFVVANERTVPGEGNDIRLRYFDSLEDLRSNNARKEANLDRNFSRFAEGTPDIRVIEGDSPDDCRILLGFHYYREGVVDRLAMGILSDFTTWRPWIDHLANQSIEAMGYQGNIGGRCSFVFQEKTWLLQEAQQNPHRWDQWNVLIGDGLFYLNLELQTEDSARSFANPFLAEIGNDQFVATLFMPSQGSSRRESGELIYRFQYKE